jgi:tetratricopeptide (TPR) repeat protein
MEPGRWAEIWSRDYWAPPEGLADPERDLLYRPLTLQTYALNHLFGEAPWHFHLVNVLLFAAVSGAIWRLGLILLKDRTAALIGAAVFAAHPIHTEAVANVVGRAELLCGLFMLAAMLVWISDGRGRSLLKASLGSIFYLAALLSKETALTLPLALIAVDFWEERSGQWRGRTSWRSRIERTYIPMAACLMSYLFLRGLVCGSVMARGVISELQNPLVAASTTERIITPLKILGLYFQLFLWPDRLCVDYSLAALPLADSLLDPTVLLGIAVLIGALAATKADRASAYLAAMFFASYWIVSNGPFLIATIFNERLLFWPSAPLCLIVGHVASKAARRRNSTHQRSDGSRTSTLSICAVLAVGGLGARSAMRNFDWTSNESLFSSAYEVNPNSAKIQFAVARNLLDLGDWPRAAVLLERATSTFAGHRGMWHLLARSYQSQSEWDNALSALEAAALLRIPAGVIERGLNDVRERLEERPPLSHQLESARNRAGKHPDDPWAQFKCGRLLLMSGQPKAALDRLLKAESLALDNPDLPHLQAQALWELARRARWTGGSFAENAREGISILEKVLERHPQRWRSRALLARLLAWVPSGESDAIEHADEAVEFSGHDRSGIIALAEVLADVGRVEDSARAYEQALDLVDGRSGRVVQLQIRRLRDRGDLLDRSGGR